MDEDGTALPGVRVAFAENTLKTDASGQVDVALHDGAVFARLSAEGMLDEPVVVGSADRDQVVRIRMLSNRGGKRWALHAAGDVMFGRRYNTPTNGDPIIPRTDTARGARSVVHHIAPMFTSADVRTLNLETVISNLPDSAAHPGKRFILNSWPDTLYGVKDLDPSFVLLANNHSRDYMDVGVTETTQALRAHGLLFSGAAEDGEQRADAPIVIEVAGTRLGSLAYTTVNGAFVNDNYPLDEDEMPSDVTASERWQWETRDFGFDGEILNVPLSPHRIGGVWKMFDQVESSLSDAERASAWSSMVLVFPELQDWVAGRGHGGAAPWVSSGSTANIEALRPDVDVLIVQLHAGFQFQAAPSDYVASIARKAIDAGADMVVCHHPHVLQGAEWYKDKLIVYSLGNFVFDQDFSATFSTAILRTVWDESTLYEARFLPVEIAGYRPMPVANAPATRTLLRLWEMSLSQARAARTGGGIRVIAKPPFADTLPAQLRLEHNSARIVRQSPEAYSLALRLGGGETKPFPERGLVDPRLGLDQGADDSVLIGRDLLGWGDFEDHLADALDSRFAQWSATENTDYKRVIYADDAPSGFAYLSFTRTKYSTQNVLLRPVARTPLLKHRLYTVPDPENAPDTYLPADGEVSYTVRLKARLRGEGTPLLRFDLYSFDDTNPTEDPSSSVVGNAELNLDVEADGQWHALEVPISRDLLSTDGLEANMVMFYMGLAPPPDGSDPSQFDVDQVELLEWRPAARMPDRLGAYDYARNTAEESVTLRVTLAPFSE